jgi:hypothetical protein
MALNSSGPISLGGSTPGQSINLELSQSATAQISLNDTNVRTLAAVASGAIIMPTNFYGKSTFAEVFNNAEVINLSAQGSPNTYQATYTINTAGTCTKFGSPFGLSFSFGPTAWGTPTGGTPGNNFEARLNVTAIYLDTPALSYVRFAGVDVATTGYTPWYSLSSNRAIDVQSSGQVAALEGTLFIRNTTSLVEISRAFSVYADPTF